jgi:hypothetical protein
MFLFDLASKLGTHPVNIAHFLEISTRVVVYQNIDLWVPSNSGMRVLACNRLLEYAIYICIRKKLKRLLIGFALKLDLHPVTI